MIDIATALDLVRANYPAPQAVLLAAEAAHGHTLADDVAAREDSPRFDNSAMDGWCVRWDDVCVLAEAESPESVALRQVGESRAGTPYAGECATETAVRISTGAPTPAGYDTVIPQEDCRVEREVVHVLRVRKRGANIRRRGEEFKAGAKLLRRGMKINAARIGVLTGQGHALTAAFRRLRAAIIITGSELRPHWQSGDLPPGVLRDSNGPMLRALTAEAFGEATKQFLAGDTMDEHAAALDEALEAGVDLILFSGGVSVGPHDLVRSCAAAAGFETIFWRVDQKPGKPLLFARRGSTLLFGLPGNPVSAHVCFSVYVRPLLLHAAGMAMPAARSFPVLQELHNPGRRAVFMRVAQREEDGVVGVEALQQQGSHMLSGVSEATGIVLLPAGARITEGEFVEVIPV